MEKTLNFEFFIVSFNGFCIYFLLELLLHEILLIVRNFSHSKESDSFITLVYTGSSSYNFDWGGGGGDNGKGPQKFLRIFRTWQWLLFKFFRTIITGFRSCYFLLLESYFFGYVCNFNYPQLSKFCLLCTQNCITCKGK